MSTITIVSETDETVTIRWDELRKLLDDLEAAEDRAAVTGRRTHEALVGKEAARRNYLTASEAERLLNGESPVKVWREKRCLSQRTLAHEANISNSYLAEIEMDRKPGSDDAYRKLAAVLQIPADELDSRRYRTRQPDYGPVLLSWMPASINVAPGQRGAAPERKKFATLKEALSYVREEWSSLCSKNPWITDGNHAPIFMQDELVREIES